MGAAAAVIVIRERHIVEAFERLGATSAARAIDPSTIGAHTGAVGWRRLRGRRVVCETAPGSGTFYLDVERWEGLRRFRRRVASALMLVVVIAGIVAWYAGTSMAR